MDIEGIAAEYLNLIKKNLPQFKQHQVDFQKRDFFRQAVVLLHLKITKSQKDQQLFQGSIKVEKDNVFSIFKIPSFELIEKGLKKNDDDDILEIKKICQEQEKKHQNDFAFDKVFKTNEKQMKIKMMRRNGHVDGVVEIKTKRQKKILSIPDFIMIKHEKQGECSIY